jgi:hypothetical protein
VLSVAPGNETGIHVVEERAEHKCAGVFDFQWRPPQATDTADSSPNACTALADGSCQLLCVSGNRIEPRGSAAVGFHQGSAVSCDWDVHRGRLGIVSSTSTGALVLCELRESALEVTSTWQGHALEAWMITCHPQMVRARSICFTTELYIVEAEAFVLPHLL